MHRRHEMRLCMGRKCSSLGMVLVWVAQSSLNVARAVRTQSLARGWHVSAGLPGLDGAVVGIVGRVPRCRDSVAKVSVLVGEPKSGVRCRDARRGGPWCYPRSGGILEGSC